MNMSSRGSFWFSIAALASLAMACASPARPTAAESSRSALPGAGVLAEPEPSEKAPLDAVSTFPGIRLIVHNFAADEGEMWTYEIYSNSVFSEAAGCPMEESSERSGVARDAFRCR